MFTFEKTDEGFQVFAADRRAVATVDCCRAEWTEDVEVSVGPDRKKVTTRTPRQVVDKWPREKWVVHFTGHKFSAAQLDAFVKELAAQEF